jgi:hypothetical protein
MSLRKPSVSVPEPLIQHVISVKELKKPNLVHQNVTATWLDSLPLKQRPVRNQGTKVSRISSCPAGLPDS